MDDDLANDGWIISVELPEAGHTRYLAGFDTPREAMLAMLARFNGGRLRFKRCARLTSQQLHGARLRQGELRQVSVTWSADRH